MISLVEQNHRIFSPLLYLVGQASDF